MPLDEPHSLRRRLFLQGVLGVACGMSTGCEAEWASTRTKGGPRTIGSFHIAGEGMYEGFQRWLATVTSDDRAAIDELIGRKELLIHVFLAVGRLPQASRGGMSGFASGEEMTGLCDFHPIVGEFSTERNWDVIYDPELTKKFEEDHGIPTPPEVILQHEIFGHVLPVLRNPGLLDALRDDEQLKDANEREAFDIENRYRKRLGLREVPPELQGFSPP